MSAVPPFTTLADPGRPMPDSSASRLDHAHAALAALGDEQRRLERLGLELAQARCADRIRYWRFVAGLLALTPQAAGPAKEAR